MTKSYRWYDGSVDLEDVGYLGKPINDRRYPNEQLAGALHKVVAYARKMDGLVTIPSGCPNTISRLRARSASPTC